MDLLSLAFVLVILVASGLIAWVADGLGKKIGKKRLSVFGLRPKHVASLGTVAMGVTVSFLTLVFIAAVSKDVRIWLVQGRQLLVQRDELLNSVKEQRRVVQDLNQVVQDLNGTIRADQSQIRTVKDELLERKNEVSDLDTKLREKNAALQKAEIELEARRGQIVALRAQLPELKRQVASAQRLVTTTNRLLKTVRQSLRNVQSNLRVAQANLRVAQSNSNTANAKANQALLQGFETYKQNQALNEALAEEVKTRKEIADRLRFESATLIAQRDEAQDQADAALARYTMLQGQLETAAKELDQMQVALQGQAEFLNSGYKTSRTEDMTFRRGEELARVTLPADANVDTVRDRLAALLRSARIVAADRGAKGHRVGKKNFESADIVDRKDPKTGTVVDSETLKRALIANLAGQRNDQVIVATSSLNAFAGEPVSLDLAALPNPVVYHRNDTVAEARIDGSLSEDRILAQLSEFVNGPLRKRATQDRMIPRAGTAAPFGDLSGSEVWTLLQSVRRAGRSVRVQAVAGDEIRAADPLRLEFRVH